MVQAFEFQTALNDGIIRIPAEYQNKLTGKVKVIIMQERPISKKIDSEKSSFPYFAVDTTGFLFNRDEANER